MRIIVAAGLASTLAACSSNSGVFQTGPDTYQITTTAITSFGGAGAARGAAIQTANDHCARMGKRPMVLDTASDSQITMGSSEVKFRCVGP